MPSKGDTDTAGLRVFDGAGVEYIVYKETQLRILFGNSNIFKNRDIKENNRGIARKNSEIKEILQELKNNYAELEDYIRRDPFFRISYSPVRLIKDAPQIARTMSGASKKAGVGPMAAVAGTFSELIGRFILNGLNVGAAKGVGVDEIIVENGGDIFLKTRAERTVGIYAGDSPFSGKLGFKINPRKTPVAICTSSGSVGHSISMGNSDAVVVISDSCALADAAATSIGNFVDGKDGIERGITRSKEIDGIDGVLIIRDEEMGTWGNLPEIIKL